LELIFCFSALRWTLLREETCDMEILKAEFDSAELGYFKNNTGVIYAALVFFTPQES